VKRIQATNHLDAVTTHADARKSLAAAEKMLDCWTNGIKLVFFYFSFFLGLFLDSENLCM
jgi:hypothetical protein